MRVVLGHAEIAQHNADRNLPDQQRSLSGEMRVGGLDRLVSKLANTGEPALRIRALLGASVYRLGSGDFKWDCV